MVQFTVRNAVAGSTGAGNLSATAQTLPTHVAGDLLFLAVGIEDATATMTVTGSGWAEHPGSPFLGTSTIFRLYWKLAASSSETQPTLTIANANNVNDTRIPMLASIAGTNGTLGPYGSVSNNASAVNVAFTQGVTVRPGYGIIGMSFRNDDGTRSGITGTPLTINTNVWNQIITTGNDATLIASIGENATSSDVATGTSGIYTITGSTTPSVAFYITFPPLGASVGSSTDSSSTVDGVGQAVTQAGGALRNPLSLVQHLLVR